MRSGREFQCSDAILRSVEWADDALHVFLINLVVDYYTTHDSPLLLS